MGTKGYLVPEIHKSLEGLTRQPSRVIDLFAGTGAVASSFANQIPVTCGDALEFIALLARTRFLCPDEVLDSSAIHNVVRNASELASARSKVRSSSINEESRALASGARSTHELVIHARHASNSSGKRAAATAAKTAGTYRLTELYFARGYFSTAQAIEIDAVRSVIDRFYPEPDISSNTWTTTSRRDWLLAAWIIAASRICNSPGHTAQFLKSASARGHSRVSQNWSRRFIEVFLGVARSLVPAGSPRWRGRNRVDLGDALQATRSSMWEAGALLYADPPYTKDHYSRYYHLYETLLRYDYPSSSGVGRVRDDRHLSAFCYRTQVRDAFKDLTAVAAAADAPLLVSYPRTGLLPEDELFEVLRAYGDVQVRASISRRHSTLGASSGPAFKNADECLYLVTPR